MLVVLAKILVLFPEAGTLLVELLHSIGLVLDLGVASFEFSLLAFGFDVNLRLGNVRGRLFSDFGELFFELSYFLFES